MTQGVRKNAVQQHDITAWQSANIENKNSIK